MVELPEIDTAALRGAGRDLTVPFAVSLVDGETLHCEQLLRLLPAKRVVVRAAWKGRMVLAKLFIAESGYARHAERERQGSEALQQAGLHTPELLAAGQISGGGESLLYAYLDEARSLDDAWCKAADRAAQVDVLQQALTPVARMHEAGLKQDDIHLDNFLIWQDALYCIDGGGVDVSHAGEPLSVSGRLENLGLLFAQLPIAAVSLVADALPSYLEACGEAAPAVGLSPLLAEVERQRERRQREFLSKTLRDCTAWSVSKGWNRFVSVSRSLVSPEMMALINDPDRPVSAGELLKRGNTATVGVCEVDGTRYVLKRYNIKNFWHGFKRALQPSRAWRSWLAGHLLVFMGIPTPRPVLLLEERFGPLRRRAFLLTEAVSGPHALEYFLDESVSEAQRSEQAVRVLAIFSDLVRARISHGDLKATNLLVGPEGPVLIDLDAMRQHANQASFAKAFAADLDRFMRNWPQGSAARDMFAGDIDRMRARLR